MASGRNGGTVLDGGGGGLCEAIKFRGGNERCGGVEKARDWLMITLM